MNGAFLTELMQPERPSRGRRCPREGRGPIAFSHVATPQQFHFPDQRGSLRPGGFGIAYSF